MHLRNDPGNNTKKQINKTTTKQLLIRVERYARLTRV